MSWHFLTQYTVHSTQYTVHSTQVFLLFGSLFLQFSVLVFLVLTCAEKQLEPKLKGICY